MGLQAGLTNWYAHGGSGNKINTAFTLAPVLDMILYLETSTQVCGSH